MARGREERRNNQSFYNEPWATAKSLPASYQWCKVS